MSFPQESTRPKRTDHGTPDDLFQAVNAIFRFDLDAAANETNHKVRHWLGPGSSMGQDALSCDWHRYGHRIWCNPPYRRGQMRHWMGKAADAAWEGATVVMLVFARVDTAWWNSFVHGIADTVIFLKGRVQFEGEDAGAMAPSALVIYAPMGLLVNQTRYVSGAELKDEPHDHLQTRRSGAIMEGACSELP